MYSKYVEASQTANKKITVTILNGKLEMERTLDLIKLKLRAPNFENHITARTKSIRKRKNKATS